MRIVQLGPYPPPYGGIQTHLVALRRRLRSQGIPCSAINLTSTRRDEADGVYYPASALALAWRLVTQRHDIVHVHIGGRLTLRLLGLCFFCTLIPRCRSVLSFHSGGYPSSPAGLTARRWTLRGFVFRRLDAVIAVNPAIAELFRRFGVLERRLHLILPYDLPDPPDAALPAGMKAFFDEHRPVLVSVGLLEPEYNLPMQIEALGRIRERFPGAGLVLIGSGSLHGDLAALIARNPHAKHIRLSGDVPHGETLRVIAESDALLRTTQYDGDSLAVREALHLGTPVVASDNSMRPAGVHLVPAGDLHALCEAVEKVLAAGKALRAGPSDSPAENHLDAVLAVYRKISGRIARPLRANRV